MSDRTKDVIVGAAILAAGFLGIAVLVGGVIKAIIEIAASPF